MNVRKTSVRKIAAVRLVLPFLALTFVAVGCQEQRVAAPNEKAAAPARLPGEDPHAHTPTQTANTRK